MAEDPCALEPEDTGLQYVRPLRVAVSHPPLSFDIGFSVLLFQPLGAVRKQKLNGCKHAENVQIPCLPLNNKYPLLGSVSPPSLPVPLTLPFPPRRRGVEGKFYTLFYSLHKKKNAS